MILNLCLKAIPPIVSILLAYNFALTSPRYDSERRAPETLILLAEIKEREISPIIRAMIKI